ncbi:signal peptidase I [Streptococcus pseudoporcinus]|uniref:Signal peptidase I n=1 Tax=Streptococcus pseudoporcinus LQ 940-04 TaxID=875093 RepID=G5K9J7_9STRE|nr:signal peptidase I [Streptococcus pseudoporcinus]EFR43598.1 signal peptidase I [Streptococcus pseudoporcinus SPIN 20026]EHI65291.1 signal peptidase I [Streptococcus pseudoporcinus LQ 940-04]
MKRNFNANDISKELDRVSYQRRFFGTVKNTLYVLLAVASTAILIAVLWLPVLRIYGHSMNKTLVAGDVVLTAKGSDFKTGDVIAFYYNNKVIVKRVIAESGDWVNIDAKGDVYVNQTKLKEPYVIHQARGNTNIKYPYQVPDKKIFVMGDNRKTSIDSRNTSLGDVSEEQIVGKIFLRIWPLNRISSVN